jgi:hypothetical protein
MFVVVLIGGGLSVRHLLSRRTEYSWSLACCQEDGGKIFRDGAGEIADREFMKRDMDLIREILLYAEKHCKAFCNSLDRFEYPAMTPTKLPKKFQSFDREILNEHVLLAKERNLIEADFISDKWRVRRLTWEGHEFIDNSRVPEVWNAAKEAAGHLSFGVFGSVLNHLAINHGLELLKSGYDAALKLVPGS